MRPKRGKKGQNLYAHIILQQRNGTDTLQQNRQWNENKKNENENEKHRQR